MNYSRPKGVFVNDSVDSPFYVEITDPHLNYTTKDRFFILNANAKIFDISSKAFYHDYTSKVRNYPDHPLLQEFPHITKQQQIANTYLEGFNKYNKPQYDEELFTLLKDFYGMDYDGYLYNHPITDCNRTKLALFHTNILEKYTDDYDPWKELKEKIANINLSTLSLNPTYSPYYKERL